jgi:hypothetical protein
MLMGCFTCGLTYWAAVPFAGFGAFVGFFGRGNLRVAGLTLNLIALIPSVILLTMALGAAGVAGVSGGTKAAGGNPREANAARGPRNVVVTVRSTSVGPVHIDTGFEDRFDNQTRFHILVNVSNVSATKLVHYDAWWR